MIKGFDPTDKGLKEYAKELKKWMNELKHSTKFKIDYLSMNTHKNAIYTIFKKLCPDYRNFEDIDETEFKWIEACNNSGLVYCKKGLYY